MSKSNWFDIGPYFTINEFVDDICLRHKLSNLKASESQRILSEYSEILEKEVLDEEHPYLDLYELKTPNEKALGFVESKSTAVERVYLDPQQVFTLVERIWPADFRFWPTPQFWLDHAFTSFPYNLDTAACYRPWHEHLLENIPLPLDECICYAIDCRTDRPPANRQDNHWAADSFFNLKNRISGMIETGKLKKTISGKIYPHEFLDAVIELGIASDIRQFGAEWITSVALHRPSNSKTGSATERTTNQWEEGRKMVLVRFNETRHMYGSDTQCVSSVINELRKKHGGQTNCDYRVPAKKTVLTYVKSQIGSSA